MAIRHAVKACHNSKFFDAEQPQVLNRTKREYPSTSLNNASFLQEHCRCVVVATSRFDNMVRHELDSDCKSEQTKKRTNIK